MQLYVYTETMDRHYKWHIDKRPPQLDTRVSDVLVANIPDWHPIIIKAEPVLQGMLCMGMGKSHPFGFAQKRIPSAMSEKLMEIYLDDTKAFNASWLTRKELVVKATELLVSPDKDALVCRPLLLDFINEMPEYSGDARHQRAVFWFRN